jgi:transcriptional regulator with XRE-family HTH domain
MTASTVRTTTAALRAATPTLREIAERLGVSYGTIRGYATGARQPSPAGLQRLARVFRMHARRLETWAAKLDDAAERKAAQ